jgi:hypothetical protein
MRGTAHPLSRPRRLIIDLLHFASGVPSIPVQRRMDLSAVAAARSRCPDRPPWPAVFAKAFALVAAEVPGLRRAYCKFPWPHLYEYPASVASIAVEREYRGERGVMPVLVKDPAGRPLADVSRKVREAAAAPVESVKDFRRAMHVSGLPRPVRRLAWWFGLNAGRFRANYFGTFGVSAYPALGAESLHPISPLTATLTYGLIGPDGRADVRVVYDHRVLDGATVARAMVRLESILNTAVADEMAGAVAVVGRAA